MFKKLLVTLCIIASTTCGATWRPTEPINVLIGFGPGSGNEFAFRKLAAIVNETNKDVKFIVRNIAGVDSAISLNKLLVAPNDGHTIGVPSHMGLFVTNDIWQKDAKQYQYNSFTNVLTIGKSPLVLVANINSKVNTPAEFAKLIQTTDKQINFAVGGGAHRVAFEYMMIVGKGKRDQVININFPGPMQAVVGVAGDSNIEFGMMPIAIARPLIDSKKVKILGITGNKKIALLPNAPLLNDTFPKTNVFAAWSIALPPNTPKDIVDWYATTFAAAMKTPEYQAWCEQNYIFVDEAEMTPAGLAKHIEELRTTFTPIIKLLQQ